MNQNAIQTSVAGHVQVKTAVDPSNSSNVFPLRVEVDQLPRYTNGNTKPVPIMSGSNFAGAVQELKVREQNLAGTAGNGIKTTETAPVTSVSVSGTVAVNNPVAVQPALDANNVAIPLSVTETNPVTGGGGTTTGVQEVKIVGDETTGIIMTKHAYTSTSPDQYTSVSFGIVGRNQINQPDLLVSNGDSLNTGWIIRVNGQDIYNQDITLGIVDDGTTVDYNLIEIPGTTSTVNGQITVDKYHGRKVTLSSVANVWIVEPSSSFNPKNYGVVHWTDNVGNNKFYVIDETGAEHSNQVIYKDKVAMTHSSANSVIGLRVIARRDNTTGFITFWQTIDT